MRRTEAPAVDVDAREVDAGTHPVAALVDARPAQLRSGRQGNSSAARATPIFPVKSKISNATGEALGRVSESREPWVLGLGTGPDSASDSGTSPASSTGTTRQRSQSVRLLVPLLSTTVLSESTTSDTV